MTRAIQVPGEDTGSSLARGVFAQVIQGQTPKYAFNQGFREDLFRNTLARMFVRLDPSEYSLFPASVPDRQTRRNLVPRLTGAPGPAVRAPETGTTSGTSESTTATNASDQRRRNALSSGYLDFLIQSVSMNLQEKVQASETLSDNYVAYAFGQAPPIWQFQGALINSVQDDQASNMFRLYAQILRATQLARRQKSLSLVFDSYVVNGIMMNLSMQLNSSNEVLVPFSFSLLVKRVFFTNTTTGWVPTQANTPFAADLNAVPSDGRPREEVSTNAITARTAPDAQVTPTPQAQADARTNEQSGTAAGTAPPNNQPTAPSPSAAASPTPQPGSEESAAESQAFRDAIQQALRGGQPALADRLRQDAQRLGINVPPPTPAEIAETARQAERAARNTTTQSRSRAAPRPSTPAGGAPSRPETSSQPGGRSNPNASPATPVSTPVARPGYDDPRLNPFEPNDGPGSGL